MTDGICESCGAKNHRCLVKDVNEFVQNTKHTDLKVGEEIAMTQNHHQKEF